MRGLQLPVVALALLLAPSPVRAGDEGGIIIDSGVKARKGLYPIAVPTPVSSDAATAKLITEVQTFDLSVSSWFKVLDPRSFLADLDAEGMSINPQRWKDTGAYGVIKARGVVSGAKLTLQFKLYEVDRGAQPVLEREYSGAVGDARKLTHKWCNEVVRYYTKEDGFFGSQIAFSGRTGKGSSRIYLMDFDGNGVYSVTKNDSINILPAFSPGGSQIAFTSYLRKNPDLYVTSGGGGRPKRLAHYEGMNTGASYSPDGSKIAVTLSKDGNPEIYLISAADGAILSRLTSNRAIDTSPAFSPDGSEIAFVSNREGNPQIYVMGADGSNQRKVSTVGTFNQTPAWSPRRGARVIAYTTRDDTSSRFDIITVDLAGGQAIRITQNQGDNMEPTWAPNGRVIAFTSTRAAGSGIYLANADGTGEQRLVYKGSANSPDWGPLP
jgi:TolB protein